MSAAIGIDLGTTNTVVAHVQNGQARALADEGGERLIPSVVSFHPSGQVLVGRSARDRRLVDARNTVYSVKRLIGRAWETDDVQRARKRFPFELREGPGQGALVVARGETYTLPEISAYVLRRARAVAEHALGEPVTKAVITVPANFNDLQRAATKVAGRVAGLDVLRILNEPTAAALAYGYGRGGTERVAVFDLGGGTFDITFLDLTNNVFEVVATAGDTFLGGDDLDLLIAERMADAFLRQHRYDVRADPQAFERLRVAAEGIKVRLSTQPTAFADLTDVAFGPGGKALGLGFSMSRSELNALIDPLLDRAFQICEQALAPAHLELSSFQSVLLVGGSTRIPRLRERAASFFSREPRASVSPDEVVALGAAIQAMALTSDAYRADAEQRASGPSSSPRGPRPSQQAARATTPLGGIGASRPASPPPAAPAPPEAKPGDASGRMARYTLAGIGTEPPPAAAAPQASAPRGLVDERALPHTRPEASSMSPAAARGASLPPRQSQTGSHARAPLGAGPVVATPPLGARRAGANVGDRVAPYPPGPGPSIRPAGEAGEDLEAALPLEDSVARMFPHPPSATLASSPAASATRATTTLEPGAERGRSDDSFFGVRDDRGDVSEPSIMARLAGPGMSTAPSRMSAPPAAQRGGTQSLAPMRGAAAEPAKPFPSITPGRTTSRMPMSISPAPTQGAAPTPSMGPHGTAAYKAVTGAEDQSVAPYSIPATRVAADVARTAHVTVEAPLLLDVTPQSLCVETVGGYCDVIVGRNTRIPCEQTRVFATVQGGQSVVHLRVAQGESQRFAENTPLGELELSGLRQAARGDVTVAVTFAIDADGILQIRARDTATGQQASAVLRVIGAAIEQDPTAMRARQEGQRLVY